jgi:hypothetical protein
MEMVIWLLMAGLAPIVAMPAWMFWWAAVEASRRKMHKEA